MGAMHGWLSCLFASSDSSVFMTSTELRNMLLSTAPVTRITTTLFYPTRRYCLKQASAVADGPARRNRAADRA